MQDYNYSVSGKLETQLILNFRALLKMTLSKEIKNNLFSNIKIKSTFNDKNINFNGQGKYSFNNLDFLNINFENNFQNQLYKFKLDFDFKDDLKLDLINYKKKKINIANLTLDFEKIKNINKINDLIYKEGNNFIKINSLGFKKDKILSFKRIEVFTNNNEFLIKNDKKISIKGSKFDASNLAKFLKIRVREIDLIK